MAQIDNTFIAFFLDTSTAPWTPLTGLSATFTIVNVDNNSIPVNDRPMTEVGGGFYKYVYGQFDPNINYAWTADPNSSSAFIISGVTQLPTWSRLWGGGGFTVNYWAINSHVTKKINELEDVLLEKLQKESIDFTPILDKIDSIEIPEIPETKLEEKEAKKALKLIEKLDKKLTEYIESEMSDKEELDAISREFTKLEMEERQREMEEERKRKEKEDEERKMEEEMDKKLLEEIQAEFDKMEEEDKMEEKKEIEEEIKEMEKEIEKKKQELKSL